MSQSPKNVLPGLNFEVSSMSAADHDAIKHLSGVVRRITGVQLSDRHQAMVASRLQKRVAELGLGSLTDYVAYLGMHAEEETIKLVGLLTTHHTYFFREFSHFEYLRSQALPELIPLVRARPDKTIKIWSAACSRGQEVYSLAMYLKLHLPTLAPDVSFEILGTDVDKESVMMAINGVYPRRELKEAPLALLGDHWQRGSGEISDYVKAKKTLRDHCRFKVGNLLELTPDSPPQEHFDLIFCRNVFIYFTHDQIRDITRQLLGRMSPEGFLFIGISESLSGLELPVGSPGPSVYRHRAMMPKKATSYAPALAKAPPPSRSQPGATTATAEQQKVPAASASQQPARIRVLCVDDSPSILTLMKRILSAEEGFEIVGTAENGIEAAKQVAALKPDIVTLDIHMPQQTGVEYLERNYRKGHPPVVMVTSVSREDSGLAGRALSLGAADYVEKPALTNLLERGEEIRTKLRCAVMSAPTSGARQLDRDFLRSARLESPEKKLRLISCSLSSRQKIKALLQELQGKQPHCILLIEGSKAALPGLAKALSDETGKTIQHLESLPSSLPLDGVSLMDSSSALPEIKQKLGSERQISILVYGEVSKAGAQRLLQLDGAQLLLEDLGSGKGAKALMEVASDVTPCTSFAYLSHEFFCSSG
ncbi:MAG: hypothetical protein RJB38_1940, partial [Pseudomonadota bacterium]